MPLSLTSTAFKHHGEIPSRFTCDDEGGPPPLAISGVPEGAKSLALIVDDPDAPRGTWVHWIVVDLPVDTTAIGQDGPLPRGAHQGINDSHEAAWGPPCPPSGTHRYFFKLYALDRTFPELKHPTRAQLEKAMAGHVLEHAELMGTYRRHHR